MLLKMIAAPLMGALIGYITNDIAVKMLFRPRNAVYIGNFRLPLTPGLIPRQRERIANSLGAVVSSQLMDKETVTAALTSRESVDSLREMFGKLALKWESDTRTIGEALGEHIKSEDIEDVALSIREKVTASVSNRIEHADIGHRLLKDEKSVFLHGIIKDGIANYINRVAAEKLPGIIYDEIGIAEEELLEMQLCDVYDRYRDKIPDIVEKLVNIYEDTAVKNVDRVLDMLNIEKTVKDKVMRFDAEELEKLIFGIMHREFKAIVYFGALLGLLMGVLEMLIFI